MAHGAAAACVHAGRKLGQIVEAMGKTGGGSEAADVALAM